eukprot:GHVU01043514.1.p1 GENE.GHVU01043514.1~~GHVU01043514.1.p1  ORF type:complete len:195 (-),score=10.61 GHVU01043514.1:21-605(-)
MVCSWHALARTLVAVCFRAPCPCTPCSKDIESMLRASRELETTWRHDELSSATQKQYEIVRNNFFKHSLIIRLDPTPNDSSRKAKARQVPAAWNRVHPQPPPVPAQQSLPVPRPAAHHDLHLKNVPPTSRDSSALAFTDTNLHHWIHTFPSPEDCEHTVLAISKPEQDVSIREWEMATAYLRSMREGESDAKEA